jgi:ABC-type sugar transport system permease subunit
VAPRNDGAETRNDNATGKRRFRFFKNLKIEQRRGLSGFIFCIPFIIGFFAFFLVPMIQSIRYAFSAIHLSESGIDLEFVGFKNFKEALFSDPTYIRTIAESMKNLIIQVPAVIIFSMFIALLLNQKFRGRVFARAIFFLPVIVISGVVLEILQTDYLSSSIMNGESSGADGSILTMLGLPQAVSDAIMPVVQNSFNLVWISGVQILLFLAGLQTIPPQLYEVSKIEGATAWETFWKVTFPLITPIILMNIVYTIVDYFTTSTNPVIKLIQQQSSEMKFEYAAGLSWMYMLVILILLGLVYKFFSKRVVYL